MAMHLLGLLASIAIIGKVKNAPMLLVPYMKKRYLRLITLRKTLTEMYSITGVNIPLFQASRPNA
jgi:hypothetical protein